MMRKIFLGLIVLSITLVGSLSAQSLSDIQNIKVDQLTDAQVRQLYERAEATGMSEQQLEALAAQRGMPASEIAKLRQRLMSVRSQAGSESGGKGAMNQITTQGRQLNTIQGDDIFESLATRDTLKELTAEEEKTFGLKLFHQKNLSFNPSMNIATPKSYVVGPGDELLVEVYGDSESSYNLPVSPEGTVQIPRVGVVRVGGLDIAAVTNRLKTNLGRINQTLLGSNPSSYIQVSLGNIRSITVNMVGELHKPGTYTLPAFASVFNALYAAGGPTVKGTFRTIQVYRANKLVADVDIYDFLVNGQTNQNVRLEDNDFVIVKPAEIKVEIEGPVRREGIFEMKSGETVADLVRFAGGFGSDAYTERLVVKRKTGTQLKVADVSQEQYTAFQPMDGDFYEVGELIERYENRVQITGAVNRPGPFELTEGLSVKRLIEKAEGLRGDAFLNRASLYRTNADFTLAVESIDLKGIMEGTSPDVTLRNEDVLNIPSIYDMKQEYFIQINGAVNRTGIYPYAEGMTVGDLITKSGGFREEASGSFIEIARRVRDDVSGRIADIITLEISRDLTVSEANQAVKLEPFDQVFIRKSPGYQVQKLVKVEGEVYYPGEFALDNAAMRISDLLKRAGGLNDFAYVPGATLIRRTEFYEKTTERKEYEKFLIEMLDALGRRDGLTEAEKQVMERFDAKLVELEKDKLKEELEKRLKVYQDTEADQSGNADFRRDRFEQLSAQDSAQSGTQAKVEFKTEELIGIDLAQIIANPGSKYDLILQEGDELFIPKELQTVRMRGQVLYPTTARFDTKRSFKDYISRAGGFSEQARKGKSYVVYANGDVKRTKKVLFFNNFPEIEPGAEIFVPMKPQREPMSVQAWFGIASSLGTIALIVNQLSR